MILSKLDFDFPLLRKEGYEVTSPAERDYNCIAWAFGDKSRWWWPDKYLQYYWPPNVKRDETLESFIEAFKNMGFEICEKAEREEGFEKISIYSKPDHTPTHAARQLENGKWTSKLGQSEDIEHNFDSITGPCYGSVAVIMKRPIQKNE